MQRIFVIKRMMRSSLRVLSFQLIYYTYGSHRIHREMTLPLLLFQMVLSVYPKCNAVDTRRGKRANMDILYGY
jgi:hypothetical protein